MLKHKSELTGIWFPYSAHWKHIVYTNRLHFLFNLLFKWTKMFVGSQNIYKKMRLELHPGVDTVLYAYGLVVCSNLHLTSMTTHQLRIPL